MAGRGVTSACGLFLWSSCDDSEKVVEVPTENHLKQRSFQAFSRFEEVWDFNDFWKRGNTFDACLRFTMALVDRWPEDPEVQRIQRTVSRMLAENLAFFNTFDPGALWADDFGWWGLMALNARRHLLKTGEKNLAEAYWRLSTDLCWQYKKATAYDASDSARPVPHGCRNGDANGQSLGVKNTVTNVLLFLLSSRIYRVCLVEELADREKYLDMAYRQWVWFESWFELEEYQYLQKLNDEAALVQERPIAIFEGSGYQDKSHPPWAEGWIWTGDQGMLVGALTDMLAVEDNLADYLDRTQPEVRFDVSTFDEKARSLVHMIGRGVKDSLVGAQDGILREAPCYSSFGPVHGNDYLAGRGIMMRYLGAREEKALLGVDLTQNIVATADAVWETRDPATCQFQPEYTTPENDWAFVEQFQTQWGYADEMIQWDLAAMKPQNRDGVCQAIGLDAIGAAIRSL